MPNSSKKLVPPSENGIALLIVEDTEAIVFLLSHFLSGFCDDIAIARNGLEAVQKVVEATESATPFDVVLMDLQMPVMSGLQAAKELRSRGIDVPLVAMTAGAMEARECRKAGFDAYVAKPFDRRELIGIVKRWSGMLKDQ
ncbi:response regulator [Stieleria marina]